MNGSGTAMTGISTEKKIDLGADPGSVSLTGFFSL